MQLYDLSGNEVQIEMNLDGTLVISTDETEIVFPEFSTNMLLAYLSQVPFKKSNVLLKMSNPD